LICKTKIIVKKSDFFFFDKAVYGIKHLTAI